MRAKKIATTLVLSLCSQYAPVGDYLADRARDFADCFILEVGYGLPASAHVQVTRWVSTGVGFSGARRWGLVGRRVSTTRTVHVGLPFSPLTWLDSPQGWFRSWALPAPCTDRCTIEVRDLGTGSTRKTVTDSVLVVAAGSGDEGLLDAFDTQLTATLIVSVRVGIRPGQFADFVLGFFGFDIAGDDAASQDRPAAPQAK